METIFKMDTGNWEQHHDCRVCDSKLKINMHDLIFQKELQGFYDIESENYYVSCPICSNLSYVQQQDIPKLIQLEVKGNDQVKKNNQKALKEEQKSFLDKFLSLFN